MGGRGANSGLTNEKSILQQMKESAARSAALRKQAIKNGLTDYEDTEKGVHYYNNGGHWDTQPNSMFTGVNKSWDYRGTVQAVDAIEKSAKEIKSHQQAAEIHKALNNQEKLIRNEISRIEQGYVRDGNVKVLNSQLRRVRQLKKTVLSKKTLG